MTWRDSKYFFSYFGPLTAYLSVGFSGFWTYSAVILAFVLIPVLELFLDHEDKFRGETISNRSSHRYFDLLLYLNVPIIYGLVFFYLHTVTFNELATYEIAGMTLGVGTFLGANGINVAHELGHRSNWWEKYLSLLLLIPAFYQHFQIEHNRGHHRYVATPEDPATARYGESYYRFWVRSTFGSIRSAWLIEADRLGQLKKPVISFSNQMIQFICWQVIYLVLVIYLFGFRGLFFALIIGIIAFSLLEAINYIEHYGLIRSKNQSGKYERVGMEHSWNSNHELGRLMLYELTYHADHHYKASKKYQLLQHVPESPQLPTGYPGCIVLALIPPLWFRVMNQRVPVNMLP